MAKKCNDIITRSGYLEKYQALPLRPHIANSFWGSTPVEWWTDQPANVCAKRILCFAFMVGHLRICCIEPTLPARNDILPTIEPCSICGSAYQCSDSFQGNDVDPYGLCMPYWVQEYHPPKMYHPTEMYD